MCVQQSQSTLHRLTHGSIVSITHAHNDAQTLAGGKCPVVPQLLSTMLKPYGVHVNVIQCTLY